jgi:hypothetical protein
MTHAPDAYGGVLEQVYVAMRDIEEHIGLEIARRGADLGIPSSVAGSGGVHKTLRGRARIRERLHQPPVGWRERS